MRLQVIYRARLIVAVAPHFEMRADVAAMFCMSGHDAHTLVVAIAAGFGALVVGRPCGDGAVVHTS